MDSVALIGFMGSGKSTVGPLLAAKLGMDYVELDDVISAHAGMGIVDIFERRGEEGFRELESMALSDILREGGKVISCGGGVVLRADNLRMLRQRCRIFLLEISRRTAVERLREADGRPLLEGGDLEERVSRLMDERAGAYTAAAHEVIAADVASPEDIAKEIAERWQRSG